MRRRLLALLIAAALAALPATAAASPGPLQAARTLTARYHSIVQSALDGYSTAGEPCVASPFGTMGIHAVNFGLAGDLEIDPLRPEILLYLPDESGDLQLVGVEYFEVALANTESGPAPWFATDPNDLPPLGWFNPAPSVFGQTFEGPMPGHNPSMPWHYDRHVWLWADNPDGMFATWNPSLSCPE